jgi:hypothetical protein
MMKCRLQKKCASPARTISLPKIKKGSYKLVVVYSGTDTTATAKSAAVKLKVK